MGKNNILFFIQVIFVIFLIALVTAQETNDTISPNNLTTSTEDNLSIEREVYAPLIQRLGIPPEEEISQISTKSMRIQDNGKGIPPQKKSNSNLINIIDKKEFKEYVEKNDEHLPVIIILSKQNFSETSRRVKEEYKPTIESKLKQLDEVDSQIQASSSSIKTPKQIENYKEIAKEIDADMDNMRKEILEEHKNQIDSQQNEVKKYIEDCGGIVTGDLTIINSVFAKINLSCIEILSQREEIIAIYEDEKVDIKLNNAACTIGASSWYNAGYDGGIWDVAIVDTGIDGNHPKLSVDYSKVFHDSGRYDPYYDDDYTTTNDLNGHGTHVAGIVASQDSTYKGIGYGLDALINVKAGWNPGSMYNSDMMAGVEWAINTAGADVISYSYGSSYSQISDCASCRFFDAVVDDLGIVVSISAGNDGPTSPSVGSPAIAYNVFSVAALDDKNNCNSNDDEIASYSSRGPTYDGRIKPDITAPGHKIRSTNAFWEGIPLWPSANGCDWGSLTNGWDFVDNCGTSMAAPVISGSIPLVLDYKGYRWDPKAIRALFFNTAKNSGTFSSKNTYGYGVLDLSRAYTYKDNVILDYVQEGGYRFYKKNNYASGERATLVWNRHVTYNNANYPTEYYSLNDLDLQIYDGSGNLIAYSNSGENNVEQAVQSISSYNPVYIKVKGFTTDYSHGYDYEDYALATEGSITSLNGPSISFYADVPYYYEEKNLPFNITTTLTNYGDMAIDSTQVKLNLPSELYVYSGYETQFVGKLDPAQTKEITWQVSSNEAGYYNGISVEYTGYFFGEYKADITNEYSININECVPYWVLNYTEGECINGKRIMGYYDFYECGDDSTKPEDIVYDCSMEIFSPQQRVYNSSRINLEVSSYKKCDMAYSDYILDFLEFIKNEQNYSFPTDKRPTTLCKDCNEYNRSKTFSDGFHYVYVQCLNEPVINKSEIFLIDDTKPRISSSSPKRNEFTNGSNFIIKYTEEYPTAFLLNVSSLVEYKYSEFYGINNTCPAGRNKECFFSINLNSYNNQEVEYSFLIQDIAEQVVQSKPVKIKVDTIPPKLNNPSNFWEQDGKYIKFIFDVTETNFDEITYIDHKDNRPREIRLCSRLRYDTCEAKKSFMKGNHNLTISIKDKAGNSDTEIININIV